jgi:hypothetical protein
VTWQEQCQLLACNGSDPRARLDSIIASLGVSVMLFEPFLPVRKSGAMAPR